MSKMLRAAYSSSSWSIGLLIFLWLLSSTINVACAMISLSIKEELELEKQLRLLNKPAVETIKTVYGDTYNCVDFYQQPAFDHPLLKNHTFDIQTKPTFNPKRRNSRDSSTSNKFGSIWVNGVGCPNGTVPIRRTTKDDLIRAKRALEIYGSNINPQEDRPGMHSAKLRTTDQSQKYYGAGMKSSLWNPQVQGDQYSLSQIRIQNGQESISVGWRVQPSVYKDTQTRFFIYTQYADGSQCFNTQCPGFVITRPDLPPDMVLSPTSRRGGPIYDWHFFIYKDAINGNWFLQGEDDADLGFWPNKVFKTLADSANYIEWGGEVYSPPNVPSPPMGSGSERLMGDTRYDAFVRLLSYIKGEKHEVSGVGDDAASYADLPGYYQVKDEGGQGGVWGRLVLYGGKGGHTGN